MEQFTLPNCSLTLPWLESYGLQSGHQYVGRDQQPLRLLIAINDLAADGRDISWLWDVDFEILAREEKKIQQLVCSGLRAEDMALRLKYAGFQEEKLSIEHSLLEAVELLANYPSTGEEAVFILPTYTVLFRCGDL
jgi:hypothetical protein